MGYPNFGNELNKHFLVTGGAGFIGSNICDALVELGCKVTCLDNLTTGRIRNIENLFSSDLFQLVEADIRDYEDCLRSCMGVDFVLHQAALGSVPGSINEPLLYEDVNVKGTLNMLNAAKEAGVIGFIYASSSSVYGDSADIPMIERNDGLPLSPYALTKRVCEDFASIYSRLYGLPTVGLRYFNVYGKRQDPNSEYAAVIPRFIKDITNKQQVVIYGDGNQTRDFIYVDDVVQANIKACRAIDQAAGHVLNVANGVGTSLIELVDTIENILSVNVNRIFLSPRDGDIKHSKADISLLKKYLEYEPRITLREGLIRTTQWFINDKSV